MDADVLTLTFQKCDPPSDEPQCPICYDDWQAPDTSNQIVVSTECKHVFHLHCLSEWLLMPRNTCPCCRNVIYEDEDGEYEDEEDFEEGDDEEDIEESEDEELDREYVSLREFEGQFSNSQFFLFARPIVEELVLDALRHLNFDRSTHQGRFVDAAPIIANYVLHAYEEKYTGTLWDPLPRRPEVVVDSALRYRVLMAFMKVCDDGDEPVGTLITQDQLTELRDMRRAYWRDHTSSWTLIDRKFAEEGLHLCTLRLSDFFSRRSRSDLPIWSEFWQRCPRGVVFEGRGEEEIENYFTEHSDTWMATNPWSAFFPTVEVPIVRLFTELMLTTNNWLCPVETKEDTHMNQVIIRTNNGSMRVVTFYYEQRNTDMVENYEPDLFELTNHP